MAIQKEWTLNNKTPFKERPMIPPIGYREKMKQHVEDIVVDLTFEILQWKDNTFLPKQKAYGTLVKKGFRNDEFTRLTQFAVDYCDYQMYGLSNHSNKVIPVGVRKVTELYLARLIKKEGLWASLLPGALNHYQTLAKELPELERKISEHLSKVGDILGANDMNQYPLHQPFRATDGLVYVYDGYNLHQVPQQPATTEQEWQAMQNRRQQAAFYRPQTQQAMYQQPMPGYQVQPQNTQNWGPNPTGNTQLGPMTQHNPNPTGYAGTYAGYNPNQQQTHSGGGMGPYRGNTGTPPPQNNQPQNNQAQPKPQGQPGSGYNPQASSGQRHLDFPSPQPEGSKIETPAEPTPRPGTKPKVVETTTVVEPTPHALMKTHSGFECEYFAAQAGVGGLKVGPPIIFDSTKMKGVYELSPSKAVSGFKLIPYEGDDMDYDKHETAQFFDKVREVANEPNRKKTAAMLANVQRELFVEESLADIEARVIEGNVSGDVGDFDLTKPYILTTAVVGSPDPKLYIQNFKDNTPDIPLEGRVVNFEYISDYKALLEGELAEEAIKIRDCKDWSDLKDILRNMVDLDLPIDVWHYLNGLATDYVNDVLHYRLNLGEVTITSFDTDIDDLVVLLYKNYDLRNDFKQHLAELCQTRLYPHVVDDDAGYSYPDITKEQSERNMDSDEEETVDEPEKLRVALSQLTDVTVLPIESSSIYIPLPQQNDEWAESKPVACTVSEKSFPELYHAIHDRVKYSNYRASHILFITADNALMYIKKTNSPEAYVISRTA